MSEFQQFGPKKYQFEAVKRGFVSTETDKIHDWIGLTQLQFTQHYESFSPLQFEGSRFIGVEMVEEIYNEAIKRNADVFSKSVYMVNDELFNYIFTTYKRQRSHKILSYLHADFCTSYLTLASENFQSNLLQLAKLKCLDDVFFLDFTFSRMGDVCDNYKLVETMVYNAFNQGYKYRWSIPINVSYQYCDSSPMVSLFFCLKRRKVRR